MPRSSTVSQMNLVENNLIACIIVFILQKGGFFVEVGGYDGVVSSNTLELERNYGWKVNIPTKLVIS